ELLHLVRRIAEALRAAVFRDPLDRAVHEQIGIAANRRREMRVGREREAEVPDVLRLITRLAQRAQDDRLDELGLGLARDVLDDAVDLLRRHAARPDLESDGAQKRDELLELV